MDILGPFPTNGVSNHYILGTMDFFIKWPEAYPCPANHYFTKMLVKEMFCQFGVPQELHSDKVCNVVSILMGEVCHRLRITKTLEDFCWFLLHIAHWTCSPLSPCALSPSWTCVPLEVVLCVPCPCFRLERLA